MMPCLEVGRFYGGGAKYKSVWDRMNQINKHAKTLRDAVEAGMDPINIELNENAQRGKTKGIGGRSNLADFLLSFARITISFCQPRIPC
jgi:hypothetical protein